MDGSVTNLAIDSLTFEDALKELDSIVQQLDRGDVALEQSIAIYERGEALKKRCTLLLERAQAKIIEIKPNDDSKEEPQKDSDFNF